MLYCWTQWQHINSRGVRPPRWEIKPLNPAFPHLLRLRRPECNDEAFQQAELTVFSQFPCCSWMWLHMTNANEYISRPKSSRRNSSTLKDHKVISEIEQYYSSLRANLNLMSATCHRFKTTVFYAQKAGIPLLWTCQEPELKFSQEDNRLYMVKNQMV